MATAVRRRVLLLNRFYWPDESATAMLATDLAEDLAAAGWAVQVVAAATGYERPSERLPAREQRRGVSIRRVWSPGLGRHRALGRVVESLCFHVAVRAARGLDGVPDVVVCMTDPPLLAVSAAALARRSGARLVCYAADLYPELAVALGVVSAGSPLTRALAALSHGALARCDRVVALGDRMRERLVAAGVAPSRIAVVAPWAVAIDPDPAAVAAFRQRVGVRESEVLVMYAGNLGRCHPWRPLAAAMAELAAEPRLHWAMVGGGANRPALEAEVQARDLQRVSFLPYQERSAVAAMLAAADLHLVSQDPRTVGLCVPSKLAGILAAGRPALFVGPAEAEIAATISSCGCGAVVGPDDADGLVEVLRELVARPARRAELAAAARSAFIEVAAPAEALGRFRAVLEAVVGQPPAAPSRGGG